MTRPCGTEGQRRPVGVRLQSGSPDCKEPWRDDLHRWVGLVYSNTEGDFIRSVSGGHGRGEIGFSYDLDDSVQIDFKSFYDGCDATLLVNMRDIEPRKEMIALTVPF